jgi:hypothetical protein
MSQTKQERNKVIVLEAFDTLFNRPVLGVKALPSDLY